MAWGNMEENDTRSSESERDSERRGGTKRREFLLGSAAALGASTIPTSVRGVSTVDGRPRAMQADEVATATSTEGMVSSVHPEPTRIGTEVLENGGNAIDAAAAVQFALNVVQPHGSGIGGGGFMLVYSAEEDITYAVDNRERAPAGADPEMFLDEEGEPIPFDERHMSGQAVGVPGTLRAIDVALKRFGTQSIPDLIQPAIDLASSGAPEATVDEFLAEQIADETENFNDAAREVFAPGGEPLEAGDPLVQPDLAETLQLIRDEGVGAFYQGEIAEAIAETVQENGGTMTTNDLAAYNVSIDHPEYVEFEDVVVRTMSLPSSGGLTVGQILKIVEGFDLASAGRESTETYHALIETFHRAYADRGAYMGDKQFVDAPWQGLLDDEYVSQRRDEIPLDEASDPPWEPDDPWSFQPGDPYRSSSIVPEEMAAMADGDMDELEPDAIETLVGLLAALLAIAQTAEEATGGQSASRSPGLQATPLSVDSGQTTHFSTADSEGNMVSWTSTIEQFFGTKIMVPDYGFMLNNELTDFDATPGGPNEVQPNKRPLSSTSPTIVFRDGEPFMTVGSPGGKTIITTVAQIIQNVATFEMSLAEAIAAPRIDCDTDPEVSWEEAVPSDVREDLTDLGHELEDEPSQLGNAQAILFDGEEYLGAADFRRDGAVDGPGA